MALMVAAGEMGVPIGIPLEVALLLAGAYTIHSDLALVLGLLLVCVADVAGTTTLYFAVRLGSGRLYDWVARRSSDDALLRRWEVRLHSRGAQTVFIGRLLPMVRMYITIAAGLTRLPARKFLIGAIPAGSLWAGLPLAIGYFFRDDVRNLIGTYTSFSHAATFILPALGPALAVVWWIQHGSSTAERIRRLRATLSLVMSLVIIAYFVDEGPHLIRVHGLLTLPIPAVAIWLGLLAAICIVLLVIGISDLRATTIRFALPHVLSRPIPAGVKTTALWFVLLVVAGVLLVGIVTHNPFFSASLP